MPPATRSLVLLALLVLGVAPARTNSPAVHGLTFSLSPEQEIVFDAEKDGCDWQDIPDTGLRAYRRDDGAVIGFDSHAVSRAFLIEPDGRFRRDCTIVLSSRKNPDPGRYDDMMWIASTWTGDGKTVFALGHNEYQGNTHPGACSYAGYLQCWYNSIVLLQSADGGRTFARIPGIDPIANAAFPASEMQGEPRGFFGPTNIVVKDGYLYTIVFTTGGGVQARGNCLFRTRQIDDDAAWEYWTGSSFAPSRRDPYANDAGLAVPCQPLDNIRDRTWSLVRHRPSGLYLASLGIERRPGSGEFAVSVSPDLLHWSAPVTLVEMPLIWSQNCADAKRYSYATLFDLDSTDRNFGDVGDHPYLYLTELDIHRDAGANLQCGARFDRRLVRYRLDIEAAD